MRFVLTGQMAGEAGAQSDMQNYKNKMNRDSLYIYPAIFSSMTGKTTHLLIAFACLFHAGVSAQTLAEKPPMGWNSYDCYGYSVREDEVKANADYMAAYLRPYGWEYIVVDYLWSFGKPAGDTKIPFQQRSKDGSFLPWLAMDEWGRLLPLPGKFPSASDGKGFRPLADYVHAKGLKFGIHVMRGIPRQAVWAKTPVKGMSGITADMIADTLSTCWWLNHMYGLDMKKPGAQEYLNSLLDLYASWGVDFIKVDDISFPYRTAEIEGYKNAIGQCGRPIVLSLSPGPAPRDEGTHVAKEANMWRVTDDVWDTWKLVSAMFDYARKWEGAAGPGHWPDYDMLVIGKFLPPGPANEERYSRLTEDELQTHMTLWCIGRSPLIIGGNLPDNRQLERRLFTNDEVLAVDQKGENPQQLYHKDSTVVWYSHIAGTPAITVAMFNVGDHARNVVVGFSRLGLHGKVVIRDLWKRQDIGLFKGKFQRNVPPHGAVLVRLTPAS
jgi:alpha-galactosidase